MIEVLNSETRIMEIARMFSGETISDEAIKVAKSML
jgi:DNA repair ATPase RecN